MKKINRDFARMNTKIGKAFKTSTKAVEQAFTQPPQKTLKQIRRRNKKTREEICTSIKRANNLAIEFTNQLFIQISESFNKDCVTGKPIRPFYDAFDHLPALPQAYIVPEEVKKEEDNSWVCSLTINIINTTLFFTFSVYFFLNY